MSTDPDPADPADLPTLAGLAQQMHGLNYLVRETAIGTAEEIDGIKTAIADLQRALTDLGGPQDEAEDDAEQDETEDDAETDSDKDAAEPVAWLNYATRKDWQELAEWVDWLVSTYELQPSRTVLPCWPAHSGVVEELAGLNQSWCDAAAKGHGKEPKDAMIFWHDRWFHPCMIRLREVSQYRLCVDGHKPVLAARPADTELLAKALAEAPNDPVKEPTTGE